MVLRIWRELVTKMTFFFLFTIGENDQRRRIEFKIARKILCAKPVHSQAENTSQWRAGRFTWLSNDDQIYNSTNLSILSRSYWSEQRHRTMQGGCLMA